MLEKSDVTTKCGYVAVVGRPNVGKSTLINRILGQKLNITSRKPQTTRHTLLGIKTEEGCQAIYVDTPGIHRPQKKAISKLMNRSALSVIRDVDLILFVVDRNRWTEEDKMVLEYLKPAECPVILVVNKLDDVDDMEQLLPHVGMLSKEFPFSDVVPVSALTGKAVAQLEALIRTRLPEGDFFFEEDQLTDRSERFLAAEIVREKIMRQLGDEVPYSSTVELEKFEESEKLIRIHALVLVERDNQKAIVIGSKGSRLKKIGSEARADMEKLFGKKVMLEIWVKVKSGWSDDERALRSLGYDSPER
jgi:GTP-binding protein Era